MSATTVSIQLGLNGKPTSKEEVKAWKCDLAGVVVSINQSNACLYGDGEKYVLTQVSSGYSLPNGTFRTIKAARKAAWRIGREINLDFEGTGEEVVAQYKQLPQDEKNLYREIMAAAK